MAKGSLKYPRYNPSRLRPKGTGAFFDYALGVAVRNMGKLKSCSLRRWGRPGPPTREPAEEPTEV